MNKRIISRYYYKYDLLVSLQNHKRMTVQSAQVFLDALLRSASRLGLEVVGGCRPYHRSKRHKK